MNTRPDTAQPATRETDLGEHPAWSVFFGILMINAAIIHHTIYDTPGFLPPAFLIAAAIWFHVAHRQLRARKNQRP